MRNYTGMKETRLSQLLETKDMRLIDLARALEVDKSLVTRWAQKEIPLGRVPEVERATGIPAAVLRPDLAELLASGSDA